MRKRSRRTKGGTAHRRGAGTASARRRKAPAVAEEIRHRGKRLQAASRRLLKTGCPVPSEAELVLAIEEVTKPT